MPAVCQHTLGYNVATVGVGVGVGLMSSGWFCWSRGSTQREPLEMFLRNISSSTSSTVNTPSSDAGQKQCILVTRTTLTNDAKLLVKSTSEFKLC